MRTRPLRRRCGLEGFATCFFVLDSDADLASLKTPETSLNGKPLDIGLDFTFLPRKQDVGTALRVSCVLVSDHPQEVQFTVGALRGVRWTLGNQSGATPDKEAHPEPNIDSGTWSLRLEKGPQCLILDLNTEEVSGLACLRIIKSQKPLRIAIPKDAAEDPDEAATPEFTELNLFGRLEAGASTQVTDWQAQLRGEWERLLEMESHQETSTGFEVLSESDEGDHVRQSILIRSSGLSTPIPADLMTPKEKATGKRPGVVAIHGHGPGRTRVTGEAPFDAHRHYGLKLVQRGYVTLCPDIRNFGVRKDLLKVAERYTRDACDVQFIRGLATGKWPAQTEAAEWRAWVDVLAQHPAVDPERLGVLGLSLGGRSSGLLTALDRRIKAGVVAGALNLLRERISYGQGCVKYLLPGLLEVADLPDLYALAAPRALFLELGANDGTSPEVCAQEAYRRIEAVYRAAGASDRLGLHVYDGGHFFHGERSLPWLDRQLEHNPD